MSSLSTKAALAFGQPASGQISMQTNRRARIVVAFGSKLLRTRISKYLQCFYHVHACHDGSSAIATLRRFMPDVAVVGEDLQPSDGFDLIRLIRMDTSLARVQIIMLVNIDDEPTLVSVANSGAQTHLLTSCTQRELLSAVVRLVNRKVERSWDGLPTLQRRALISTVSVFNRISDAIGEGEQIPYDAVSDACKPLVQAVSNGSFKDILRSVRDHDDYSYAHSLRVATLLTVFGYNLGLTQNEQLILAAGGLLHDVGKLLIPREILNKPGRLTEAEFAVMKGHVDASLAYLRDTDLPAGILTIASQHHEKLDGTGYPEGLTGRNLNDLARMASIVDVFSALTDRRVYKPPLDPEAALNLMSEDMANHLDQNFLALFREMLLDATAGTIARGFRDGAF